MRHSCCGESVGFPSLRAFVVADADGYSVGPSTEMDGVVVVEGAVVAPVLVECWWADGAGHVVHGRMVHRDVTLSTNSSGDEVDWTWWQSCNN